MKKIIAILSIVTTATMAFAQGQVSFANVSTALISTNGGSATGPAGGPIASFYYALFYSTSATTIGTMTQLGSIGTNTVTAGRFTGGSGSALAPVLAGVNIGANVNIILAGWSANLGLTYAGAALAAANNGALNTAQNAYFGVSTLANMVAGGGATPIPTVMGTTAAQIPGFSLTLVPIPEPGTMALAALGGASLLLFRRKK